MKNLLLMLSKSLNSLGHYKVAQEIEELSEYDEPWHQKVIEEFGDQTINEDEYFKQNFFEENELADIDEKIMDKEGFIGYAQNGYSSFVGSGVFGSVYRGIYNGNRAVIKIMKTSRDNEVANWKAILRAKESMPSEFKKHIPTIYALKQGTIYDEFTKNNIKYEIVIMEELFPLNKHIIEVFNKNKKKQEEAIHRLLIDEDYLYNLAKLIINTLIRIKDFSSSVSNVTPQEILKVILSIKNINKGSSKDISVNVSKYIARKKGVYDAFIKSRFADDFASPEDFFEKVIYDTIYESLNPQIMPINRGYHINDKGDPARFYSEFWENNPETGTFYRMLRELSEKFNISWKDAHINNIMMDKDGNLKIIDVGLYDIV